MSHLRPPDAALTRAYLASCYTLPGCIIHIGECPEGWIAGARKLVLLSACNPGGRRLPDGVNRRRTAALLTRLRRVRFICGEGRLRLWSEDLVAVDMPISQAVVLARAFGQNAVVLAEPGRRAGLKWTVARFAAVGK